MNAAPSLKQLDRELLQQLARSRTGLEDFGDPAVNTPLGVYIRSLQEEAWERMTLPARELAIDYLAHLLENRLRLMAARKAHPQIAQQEIRRPFIIVGPPRSGSTLLHTLLSLDPQNMAPEHWMCIDPCPPLAVSTPTQERVERASKRLMALFDLIPDIFVTHPYMIEEGANSLAECGSDIMSMAFTSQQLYCFYGGERYRRYLLEGDHSAALRFHHDFLQHAQWGNSGQRWALKGSDHLLWLGELAAQYPDAMLIWTHRDLSQQLSSLVSVQAILRGLTGHPLAPDGRRAFAQAGMELQCASFLKGMRAREAIGEERFYDVSYHDVMANPVRTMERLYERFGLQVSKEHATNIRTWVRNNPPTKHGVHKHSPAEFGFEADDINRRFEDYVERFGFGFGIRPPLSE